MQGLKSEAEASKRKGKEEGEGAETFSGTGKTEQGSYINLHILIIDGKPIQQPVSAEHA